VFSPFRACLSAVSGTVSFGRRADRVTPIAFYRLALRRFQTKLRLDVLNKAETFNRNRLGPLFITTSCFAFSSGKTVSAALRRYRQTGDPIAGSTDPHSAGNGSIMRLAPVPMFYYLDTAAAIRFAAESSRTTHGAPECIDACRLLAGIICRALSGVSKEHVLFSEAKSFHGEPKIMAIARGEYRQKSTNQIRGTGYVVESFEAALWCFLQTETFEAAILKAANLGDDADTTAAICGQVAGAFYGESGIPKKWLDKLVMREDITALADRLFAIR
jgi:ADP-ribosyl-[dinitrogen reductase] hydrolase